jgi:hypothetical protein
LSIQDAALDSVLVSRERLVLALPTGHRRAQAEKVRLRDLESETFLIPRQQPLPGSYELVLDTLRQAGVNRASVTIDPAAANRGVSCVRKQNASILDSITQEIAYFKQPLGAGDRTRLDTYLENIREIERRIKIAMDATVKEPSEEIPFGLPANKRVHYRLMYDLLALAFEGDLTRSATFMLGKDLSGASFPESGFTGGWHGTSHHGDKPQNIANYAKVNRYHVQNLAYFADKLSKIPDGDGGTVLDHILIYKGSNMGNSVVGSFEIAPSCARPRRCANAGFACGRIATCTCRNRFNSPRSASA